MPESTRLDTSMGRIEILHRGMPIELIRRMIDSLREDDWQPALINMGNGYQTLATDVRNCDRIMRIDDDLAREVWDVVKHHVPPGMGVPAGLNPMFRFLRYGEGNYFKMHYDGTYVSKDRTESRVTVQMYLNDAYEGGETVFYDDSDHGHIVESDPVYVHKPKTGDVVLFDQRIPHEGKSVRSGVKLCVRTEIMFHQ